MLILFKVLKNYHILYIVLYENIQLLVFLFEQINLKTIMQDFKKWKKSSSSFHFEEQYKIICY